MPRSPVFLVVASTFRIEPSSVDLTMIKSAVPTSCRLLSAGWYLGMFTKSSPVRCAVERSPTFYLAAAPKSPLWHSPTRVFHWVVSMNDCGCTNTIHTFSQDQSGQSIARSKRRSPEIPRQICLVFVTLIINHQKERKINAHSSLSIEVMTWALVYNQ